MTDSPSAETNLSLLKRLKLRPADESAWEEFVDRYGKRVVGWCRYWGLQDADAADVTQSVLIKISTNIGKFDKQRGSFRGWLKTIAHHAWYDLINSHAHRIAKGGEALEDRLLSEAARDDLAEKIEEAWEQELMQLATERVRLRVHPKTWQAFELIATEDVPVRQVADRLAMQIPSVYKAKSNVVKMLQAEVRDLEQSEFA
jgi:RNA polymerase sigma factor (sigma-70 family)